MQKINEAKALPSKTAQREESGASPWKCHTSLCSEQAAARRNGGGGGGPAVQEKKVSELSNTGG